MSSLVTGASGFLGGALVHHLESQGRTVRRWSRDEALDLQGVDEVFHLASPVDPSRDADMVAMFEGVVQLTERVAQACLQADVRLVHVGTCEEYGDGPCPFYEDQLPQPVSPYSTAKVAATLRVLALHRTRGLRVTVARPFLTYGPGQTGDRLIPAAIRAALGGTPFAMTEGRQTREVNYVDDMVRGIALAAAPRAEGVLLNMGGGSEHGVRDLAATVFRLAGADPSLVKAGALPRRGGEVERFYGDHTRAGELLGHQPVVTLEAGLEETIRHARNHGFE